MIRLLIADDHEAVRRGLRQIFGLQGDVVIAAEAVEGAQVLREAGKAALDVALVDLENRLRAIFEERKEKTMFIMGAPNLRYGEIVAVIDAAKGAGVEKVGIVTEGMRKAAGANTSGGE